MEQLKFERIAGEGESARYDLYVDDQKVGENLTMDEVVAEISGKYEEARHD